MKELESCSDCQAGEEAIPCSVLDAPADHCVVGPDELVDAEEDLPKDAKNDDLPTVTSY